MLMVLLLKEFLVLGKVTQRAVLITQEAVLTMGVGVGMGVFLFAVLLRDHENVLWDGVAVFVGQMNNFNTDIWVGWVRCFMKGQYFARFSFFNANSDSWLIIIIVDNE